MLTPTRLLLTVNCAAIGDTNVHQIHMPVNAIFADLKLRLVVASPTLTGMPTESFIMLLTMHQDGQWLSTLDHEAQAIASAEADGMESLLAIFTQELPDTARVTDTMQLEHPSQLTEIHVLAYPLGNAQRVRECTDRLCWLRRVQVTAAAAFVPSSMWAAVDALRASQSADTAACIAAIATATAGAATTAIQVYERRRVRAIAEAGATPLVARIV